MAKLFYFKDWWPEGASLEEALEAAQAEGVLRITREGPQSEEAIAAIEAELGVKFPPDHRAFLREGGGMKVVGDERYGFGQLTVFPLSEMAWKHDNIVERFDDEDLEPDCVPILLHGDEIEYGARCVDATGQLHTVFADDREISAAGCFTPELHELLGEVVIVRPVAKAVAPLHWVIAEFPDDTTARKMEGVLDNAYNDHLDWLVTKKLAKANADPPSTPSPPLIALGKELGLAWPASAHFAWKATKGGATPWTPWKSCERARS